MRCKLKRARRRILQALIDDSVELFSRLSHVVGKVRRMTQARLIRTWLGGWDLGFSDFKAILRNWRVNLAADLDTSMIFQRSSFTSSQRPIHTHFQPQNLPLSSRFSPKIIPSNLANSSAQPSAAKAEKEKTVNSSPDLEKNPTQRRIEEKKLKIDGGTSTRIWKVSSVMNAS